MEPIDLRSDTVTRPSPAMRKAMAEAEVGDDVYGEDPTVNRLEALAAERLGFECGVYMPSGTMSNQVAMMLHLKRGQEVILTAGAHIYEYEPGALAVLAGASPRLVAAPFGVPEVAQIRAQIHLPGTHQAPTGLIALENTHNSAGGTAVPLEVQSQLQAVAAEFGLPSHLDGARIFNAALALGVDAARVAAGFTTVSVCLSKGLGAPVGSVLLLPQELEVEARRYRKMLGGGMRQAGVLAAAGIIALQEGPGALATDHQRAQELTEGLEHLGLAVEKGGLRTNMVFIKVDDANQALSALAAAGVMASDSGPNRVRFVTHRDLDDRSVPNALIRIERALKPQQSF